MEERCSFGQSKGFKNLANLGKKICFFYFVETSIGLGKMQQKAKSVNAVLFELYSSKSKSELKTLIKLNCFATLECFRTIEQYFYKISWFV